jgi:molybdate transport system substrate-binding protein
MVFFLKNRKGIAALVFIIFALFARPGFSIAAESLTVAVAANFVTPFKEIAEVFKSETGIVIEPTFASTGSLYTQIVYGAPYDIFLSADEEKPAALFKNNFCDKPLLYATGQVVLWGTGKSFCGAKNWQEAVMGPDIQKIAIANPATAPYGAAAETAIRGSGLQSRLQNRIIIAQNVGQSFQYASSGGASAGFCALSAALSSQGKQGCYHIVESAQIRQSACRIKASPKQNTASLFLKFLTSSKAEAIKKHYGYH